MLGTELDFDSCANKSWVISSSLQRFEQQNVLTRITEWVLDQFCEDTMDSAPRVYALQKFRGEVSYLLVELEDESELNSMDFGGCWTIQHPDIEN